MTSERTTVVGVFLERYPAEEAIDELLQMGFTDDQIGFVMRDGDASVQNTRTGEGAVGGMLTGAGIGGLIAAAASLLIPGFGPVVAGGFLATVLGGAAVGAAAGGLLGALGGLGGHEHEAPFYQGEVEQGRILVTVKAPGRYEDARRVLIRHGAYDVTYRGDTDVADPQTMRLHEEDVAPRTRSIEAGEVSMNKEVVTERRQIDVPATDQEVVIERRPVERRPAEGGIRAGEEIRIPLRGVPGAVPPVSRNGA